MQTDNAFYVRDKDGRLLSEGNIVRDRDGACWEVVLFGRENCIEVQRPGSKYRTRMNASVVVFVC